MATAEGFVLIEVTPKARSQVKAMARDGGRLRRCTATDCIDAAFALSGLELPPEDDAEAAGNGKD